MKGVTVDLLTTSQVAELLGVSPATLSYWRTKRTGPEYMKFGKHVRYTTQSVQAFIESKIVVTTSSDEENPYVSK